MANPIYISDYFERLYQPSDINENNEIVDLHTDMYIPVTDDPITGDEISNAYLKMQKRWLRFFFSSIEYVNVRTLADTFNTV